MVNKKGCFRSPRPQKPSKKDIAPAAKDPLRSWTSFQQCCVLYDRSKCSTS